MERFTLLVLVATMIVAVPVQADYCVYVDSSDPQPVDAHPEECGTINNPGPLPNDPDPTSATP